MSSIAQRNKKRTVVVNQSPVTEAERARHVALEEELIETQGTNARLSFKLETAQQDYSELELAANYRIDALIKRQRKLLVQVTLGLLALHGAAHFLSVIAW